MDKAVFRAAFPEFSSTTKYPDAQLDFWAIVAERQVVRRIWCDSYDFGVQLYVAHEITLAANNVKTATSGGTPGQNGGVPASKTVGSVSVSFDSASTREKDAGWWNLTNYGTQFIRLARMYGAGCIQL